MLEEPGKGWSEALHLAHSTPSTLRDRRRPAWLHPFSPVLANAILSSPPPSSLPFLSKNVHTHSPPASPARCVDQAAREGSPRDGASSTASITTKTAPAAAAAADARRRVISASAGVNFELDFQIARARPVWRRRCEIED